MNPASTRRSPRPARDVLSPFARWRITLKRLLRRMIRRAGPIRVPVPGLAKNQQLGLGDAIKRVTGAAGIRTCRRCHQRAAFLNRQVALVGRVGGRPR